MFRRWTLNVWAGVALLFYAGLVVRLFFIQVIQNDRFEVIANEQSEKTIKLDPERGSIYDRNFKLLAFDIDQYSFGVDPAKLKNKTPVARTFARFTGNSTQHYLNILKKKGFVWLARGVNQQISNKINFDKSNPVNKIKGIGRFYPYQKAGAHILGFTNIDNIGLAGSERTFNHYLEGETGFKTMQVDGRRMLIPILGQPEKQPVDGESVILTLDIEYQLIVEEELKKGIKEYGAKGGMVVVLEPNSAEVLALASYPTFNPNNFSSYSKSERKNRVLVDPFEPGSTFKLVAAAAALQDGVFTPTDKIYCENGRKNFPGGAITDHKPYKTLTFEDVFAYSSNIAFAKIAQKLGRKRMHNYGRAFGFGETAGIELIGESKGKFTNPVHWSDSDLVRFPIGYGVLVSGLQIANAYAVVANGGYLLEPRILKGVMSDSRNGLMTEVKTDTVRQVLDSNTVRQLKKFMKKVVDSGTGTSAAIEGVEIAGKTGTTKKYDSVLKKYSSRKYIASFVGMTPVDRPRLVCLVVLDEPGYSFKYGGQSSAPIFRNIVQRVLGFVREPEDSRQITAQPRKNTQKLSLPDVTNFNVYQAKTVLKEFKFDVRTEGNGGYVVSQQPAPGLLLEAGEVVKLVLGDVATEVSQTNKVPDVMGKSIREAIEILVGAGFDPVSKGTGYVVSQQPKPNSKPSNRKCEIVCKQPVTE